MIPPRGARAPTGASASPALVRSGIEIGMCQVSAASAPVLHAAVAIDKLPWIGRVLAGTCTSARLFGKLRLSRSLDSPYSVPDTADCMTTATLVSNLPLQPTPLIGREREIKAVYDRILRP